MSVKPKDSAQAKAIPEALKKMNVEAKLHDGPLNGNFEGPGKEEIPASIERGRLDVQDYEAGKIQLRDAQRLLDELYGSSCPFTTALEGLRKKHASMSEILCRPY